MKLFNRVEDRQFDESNFHHFVWDIAWFGIALAATTRFLQVYAIRLDATPIQVALLTSLPAIVALVSSIFLSTRWRSRYSNSARAVYWPGMWQRLAFLLPVFAPLFPPEWRPIWLIFAVCLPALGEGIGAVVFLSLFRETTPEKVTTRLLSRRSLAMNITLGISALAFGFWLEHAPFPLNYQIMFLIAFAAALISMWHVIQIRAHDVKPVESKVMSKANPWRSWSFREVAFAVVVTHIGFMAVFAVTPLHLVKDLRATEGFMAIFGFVELFAACIAALLVSRIVARIGNNLTMVLAMVATSIASLTIALAPNMWVTLPAALLNGGGWTIIGITLFGVFTEKTHSVAQQDMVQYSRAYYQTIAVSVFIGPLLGSTLANAGVSLLLLMMAGALLRLLAALLIHRSVMAYVVHAPDAVPAGAGD
ncbi:MAG: MFS transporter [Chloroflexi bacterium]|nr:MFS transporter [Chloroflexota bacterium]